MIMSPHETHAPRKPKRRADFWIALVFTVIAQLVFIGLIVFSVSWRNPPPTPVTAELYTPTPEPKPLPEPTPKPPVTPPPEIKPPVQPDPEIAIKKKKEEERLKKEAEEKARQEKLKKEQLEKAAREKAEKERLDREKKEKEEKARKEAEQREADLQKMLAEQKQREEQKQRADMKAAQDRWVQSIRIKVTGNVHVPPNIEGNPKGVFLITQLPTGDVIDAKLQQSSGNAAYDDAVYRAIMKSSPLPKPERAEIFERKLRFEFWPKD